MGKEVAVGRRFNPGRMERRREQRRMTQGRSELAKSTSFLGGEMISDPVAEQPVVPLAVTLVSAGAPTATSVAAVMTDLKASSPVVVVVDTAAPLAAGTPTSTYLGCV